MRKASRRFWVVVSSINLLYLVLFFFCKRKKKPHNSSLFLLSSSKRHCFADSISHGLRYIFNVNYNSKPSHSFPCFYNATYNITSTLRSNYVRSCLKSFIFFFFKLYYLFQSFCWEQRISTYVFTIVWYCPLSSINSYVFVS